MILDERIPFKPFQYQWAYDFWFQQQNAHWLHTEIDMQQDIKDWDQNLSAAEKNVIGNILKGFAQTECEVGDYWTSLVPAWFPVPEIKMMAQTFGAFETIHATAYSYLNDTLGLDDFDAFLEDTATMNKLESLMFLNKRDPHSFDIEEIAQSIAVFSAAAEGIQLFSSFAVLMSFKMTNRLPGISQQMIFSVRDESLHSKAGCKLFRQLCDEMIQEGKVDLKQTIKPQIQTAIDLALQKEFAYIDKIFEMGDLESITKAQLKNFMYDRANRKFVELGYKPVYAVDKQLLSQMEWFYIVVSGEQQSDFFYNRETGYSKAGADWNNEDLFD